MHYTEDQTRRFYKDLLIRPALAPGVQSAALTSDIPLLGGGVRALCRKATRCRAGRNPSRLRAAG